MSTWWSITFWYVCIFIRVISVGVANSHSAECWNRQPETALCIRPSVVWLMIWLLQEALVIVIDFPGNDGVRKWVLAENCPVCFCGRLDTEIMVSVKDHCCNFMQFKVTVIGNVIEYLPICWPMYYSQYGANINYHKFRLLHWPKWHFFAYLLRLNLHFAGIMSPASSNMDVGTGESSKLKTFSTFRVSFVRLSTWVMCLLLLRN